MSSDTEDSSVLTESLGDRTWREILREHNSLVREQVKAHGCYEVKTMGDGLTITFQSTKKVLDSAIAIQRTFAESNAADGERMKVRTGLHPGEMVRERDDFYGTNVIMAPRVAGKVAGREIPCRRCSDSSAHAGQPRATQRRRAVEPRWPLQWLVQQMRQ